TINLNITNIMGSADSIDLRAVQLYEHAYRNPQSGVIQRLLNRQSEPLLNIREYASEHSSANRHYAGTQAVPLTLIQGSMDRTNDFDRNFRPIQRHTELRWQKVATAMLRGQDLPPVELVKVGDKYF